MNDEITELYYSKKPICDEGIDFLLNREIKPAPALKKGVCSKDGNIYFLFFKDGEVVRWKGRSMTDKKKQFMNPMEEESKKNFKMPFFSHSKVPTSSDLIITEGEFDCVALSQLGASNCVSLPNGSSSVESAFRNNYEFLQQFERIFIAFDMDKPGEEAAKKAMTMISPSKYRRIVFPCKDANDWLIANPDLELKDLEHLMENAKRSDCTNITSFRDFPDSAYEKLDVGILSGWQKLDDILGGIRKGEVTVVTADTGAGKSTFCLNLFKNIADQGHGIWINSYEMNPNVVLRKIASLVLGKKMKHQEFSAEDRKNFTIWKEKTKAFINIHNTKVDLEGLKKQFEMASLGFGIKYILLDHLDYIHSGGKKNTTLENIDDAVREIHAMAMQYGVAVVLVVHPKQTADDKEITMADLKGSAAIKQYADNIIVIVRMDRKDPNDKLRVKVKVCKNRFMGREGSFSMRYLPEIDGYTESF